MTKHPLRVARHQRGLTLKALSSLSGIDLTKIHNLEYGRQAREDELKRLAEVLHVPVESLRPSASR